MERFEACNVHTTQCTWMTFAIRETPISLPENSCTYSVRLQCMSTKWNNFPIRASILFHVCRDSWLIVSTTTTTLRIHNAAHEKTKRNESEFVSNQKDLIPLQSTRFSIHRVKWKLATEGQFCRIIPSRVTKECSKKTIWNIFNCVFRYPSFHFFFCSRSATLFALLRTQACRWMQKL